jgi:hypothetical protein
LARFAQRQTNTHAQTGFETASIARLFCDPGPRIQAGVASRRGRRVRFTCGPCGPRHLCRGCRCWSGFERGLLGRRGRLSHGVESQKQGEREPGQS